MAGRDKTGPTSPLTANLGTYKCGFGCMNPAGTSERYFNKLSTYEAHMRSIHPADYEVLMQQCVESSYANQVKASQGVGAAAAAAGAAMASFGGSRAGLRSNSKPAVRNGFINGIPAEFTTPQKAGSASSTPAPAPGTFNAMMNEASEMVYTLRASGCADDDGLVEHLESIIQDFKDLKLELKDSIKNVKSVYLRRAGGPEDFSNM
jgi:hypothetical protein